MPFLPNRLIIPDWGSGFRWALYKSRDSSGGWCITAPICYQPSPTYTFGSFELARATFAAGGFK